MSPSRRSLLAMLLGGAANPVLAAGTPVLTIPQSTLANRAIAVLEGLSEATGRFHQTDSRGGVTEGRFYLKRPGRARFAYDPPSGLTVIADGAAIAIVDKRLKTFERYPLSTTPLALFLAHRIRFDGSVIISDAVETAQGFTMTVRDRNQKLRGALGLSFAKAPDRLIGWNITDAQGGITDVQLTELIAANNLDLALFQIRDPRPRGTARPL